MWGLLLSGIWTAVGWIFRAIVFKGVFYIAIFYFVSEAMAYFAQIVIVDLMGFSDAVTSLGNGAGWFIKLFRLDVGLPAIIAAYVLRFSIRRLPIIG